MSSVHILNWNIFTVLIVCACINILYIRVVTVARMSVVPHGGWLRKKNLLPRVFRVWAYKNSRNAATYQRIPRVRFQARYQRTLLPLPHPPSKSHPSSQNLDFQIYHLATSWFFWLILPLSFLPNSFAHVTSYSNLYFAFSVTKNSNYCFQLLCSCCSLQKYRKTLNIKLKNSLIRAIYFLFIEMYLSRLRN